MSSQQLGWYRYKKKIKAVIEEKQFLEFKILGDFENNECIICLDNMKKDDDIIIIKCGHKYHKTCLMKWFNKKKICPECHQARKLLKAEHK